LAVRTAQGTYDCVYRDAEVDDVVILKTG
jgi:hypothetical protein